MKKISLILILFLFSSFVMGATCNGAPGRYHINPDGSNGGFIQKGAWVERGNYISVDSEICDKVIIKGRNQILEGSSIRENVIIEGSASIRDSNIYGYAKIKGLATVHNSDICQGSVIEGIKVINSNYYCQTEDPQPKDPGERADATLLGFDSDGDGVRDDIEILINNSLSNTTKKNFSTERISMKLYSKILQKEIISRSNPAQIEKLKQLKTDLLNCYPSEFSDEVFVSMYDTKERLYSMFKIAGSLHGKDILQPSKSCQSLSSFSNSNLFH